MVLVCFGYESQLFGILISADISFSRLLPTFQYTLRLWGSNLDVSCFLSSGGGTASCSNATLHWWWWANRLRSQRPRHPKGSWPVLHEVPQIERVWHPAGHKVCSYMQARNGMLTDLHAHLAQLLSMPAHISNSSHIYVLYVVFTFIDLPISACSFAWQKQALIALASRCLHPLAIFCRFVFVSPLRYWLSANCHCFSLVFHSQYNNTKTENIWKHGTVNLSSDRTAQWHNGYEILWILRFGLPVDSLHPDHDDGVATPRTNKTLFVHGRFSA